MSDYGADKYPAINKMRTVAFDYGLVRQTDLKGDQFPTTTSKKVYKLTRKIGSTRLLILVNPTDVPG